LLWLWYNGPTMTYIIGLTGNIGSGKSTVLRMLEKLGARTVDADQLVHEVMAKGSPVWRSIVDAFGEETLDREGNIDRIKLGSRVFEDTQALGRLEEIVHPAVDERFLEIIESSDAPVVAVEAVKLVESAAHRLLDSLWLVTCPAEQRLRRLVDDRGADPEDVEERLNAQMTEERLAQWADVIIDNGGDLEHTWEQVRSEWAKIEEQLCLQG
jgi:dephospho-CoA kinase